MDIKGVLGDGPATCSDQHVWYMFVTDPETNRITRVFSEFIE